MAVVNASATVSLCLKTPSSLLPTSSFHIAPATCCRISTGFLLSCGLSATTKRRGLLSQSLAPKNEEVVVEASCGDEEAEQVKQEMEESRETLLYSLSPLPLLFVAALPGAGTVRSLFGPFVEIVKSLNLPDWLVHWGHPGNMAVVLFAMGGYGTYLGFRIRFSDDVEEKAKAKDLHPKLLGGMFFFFALGATGGVTSLLTSDKPILESCVLRIPTVAEFYTFVFSPHAVTGFIGLSLLTIQTILPSLFEGKPELRNVHGILGSGIMTLFLVHAALGLQLGLSY
ncbi:hypothetical protein JRO89_XS12G0023300 [Xanthoceras sorbifolium]|uniref:Uncharacterized protein n=1 Tax=Xanthoceras sorbifolium TaxID=99658 RepID=A0ABQ8HAL4_9ROSI|nr:hypothetical protein JRO89_XS12G0023300 [Xanthoceras sorbifolium]